MEYRILIPWVYIIALIVAIVIVCVIRLKWKSHEKKNNQDQTNVNYIDQTASISNHEPISSLQGALFCTNCGVRLNFGANYCSNCGCGVVESKQNADD